MTDLLSLALPLLGLLALFAFLARGRLTAFSPRRANARFISPTGPLTASWLALVAGTWGLLDLAGKGWFPVPAALVGTLVVAGVFGIVVVPRVTVFVFAVIGLGTQFAAIADDHGAAVAIAVLLITGMITWLFGALRGFIAPGAARR